ncbi:NUDIX domain-containing protein [Mycobacterium sp.]|uniref:NUDIX domain-containing protein n=1 Tax=Mycobacterium sp. TaxID=1785 RepID=UPI002F0CF75B
MQNQIVVAGALIAGDRLLVAQRARPPELAGRWELPGGKVAPGETEAAALARELAEELGIEVSVGPRLAGDVALSDTTTLRAYLVTQTCATTASAHDHRAVRWVAVAELAELDWVPADRIWIPELTRLLSADSVR